MAGEIIRAGDKTSHGGTVVEGSQTDICMGKPISFIGHMTHCPKCNGNYPIIEGVMTTTFYGKGVAVAGMKTSCGAVLLASQFTDIVEWSSGSVNAARPSDGAGATASQAMSEQPGSQPLSDEGDDIETEHFYSLIGEDGRPSDAYLYDIYTDDKLHTKAGAYSDGDTVVLKGAGSTRLVTWLNRDGGSKT